MKLRPYLRNIYHSIRLFRYLASENSFSVVFTYLFYTILNKSKFISGVNLSLRSSSTNLTVAASCLRDKEFKIAETIPNKLSNFFIVDAGGYIGTAAIVFLRMFPNATVVKLEQ